MREIDNDSHLRSVGASLDSAVVCESPLSGARLTREHARRGGLTRGAQQRAEKEARRQNALQRLAEKLEDEAETILASYMTAIRDGDWRAAEALYDRVYGRAIQRQEIEDVTERSADVQADLAELERLDRELKARKAA